MLAIAISLLFGATAAAALVAIHGSIRRGYRISLAIRRELARMERPALPRSRATAGRASRRTARTALLPLCAAA